MKKMRKAVVFLAVVMVATMLGGCGGSFDAGKYIKALLDNSYKGDSAAFVEEKVGTKEQAETLYEQGIDSVMSSLTEGAFGISDELTQELKDTVKNVYKNVKYEIGEVKKDGDSYQVEVKYQKMNVFVPAIEKYIEDLKAYGQEIQAGDSMPSDSELYEKIGTLLKDALNGSMESVTYGDEESTTIHVNLVDKTWTPDTTDIQDLETKLLDMTEGMEAINNLGSDWINE